MDLKVKPFCPNCSQSFTLPTDCIECKNETAKICQNCNSVLCELCFRLTHDQNLDNHVYKKIEVLEPNMCSNHKDKYKNLYCTNCLTFGCIDCKLDTAVGENCKEHALVSITDMQTKFVEELKSLSPIVDDKLKYLSNTAAQIANLLGSNSEPSDIQRMRLEVKHNFLKLYANVQKHESEIMHELNKMQKEQKESLLKAKDDVAEQLNSVQRVLDNIAAALAAKNVEQQIANLLGSNSEPSDIQRMRLEVKHNFLKLYANVQKHESEIMHELNKMQKEQKESLLKAKDDVAEQLNSVQRVLDNIAAALAAKNVEQVKLSNLVASAKDVKDIPWHLQISQLESTVKVTVQDELCDLLKNHVRFEGVVVGDVPPPPLPIASPPQITKDTEEQNPAPSDWLPVDPFSSQEFDAYVWHVGKDCVLHLHEETQEDTLQSLQSKITSVNGEPGELNTGALCLARFDDEELLYRGKVVEIQPDGCLVYYVDYGNIQSCLPADVLLLPKATPIHEIPIQAHKCILAHVKPIDGTWCDNLLNYIRTCMEEKVHIKVVDSVGEYVTVEVKIKNNMWLHEHLMETPFRHNLMTD